MNLPATPSSNPEPTERRARLVPRLLTPPTDEPEAPAEARASWFQRSIKPSRVLPSARLLSMVREKLRGQVPWRRD